jgi:hypothetical protein
MGDVKGLESQEEPNREHWEGFLEVAMTRHFWGRVVMGG